MPRRYRKIDTGIWNDEKFHALSDDGKLAFFFFLTHPHMTAVGAMRATIPGLAAEMGWTPQRLRRAIQAPLANNMIEVNESTSYVAIPKFLKYNEPTAPNSVIKAWPQALSSIPECPQKGALISRCLDYLQGCTPKFQVAIGDAMKDAIRYGIPHGRPEASPIQEHEQEQELEQEDDPLSPLGNAPNVCGSLTEEHIRQRWNRIPGVKPCREVGTTIRRRIRTLIQEKPSQEWWDRFFQQVEASDFLCGRICANRGTFQASLSWSLTPKILDKILAGDYDSVALNAHRAPLICMKRVPSPLDERLHPCGAPAVPHSSLENPRCATHFNLAHIEGVATC